MSWIWQRGGTPDEFMGRHGLRPLTWRDRLFWERCLHAAGAAALWIAIVLWLLSRLYDVGPLTVLVVTWIGLWVGAIGAHEERFRGDLRRWPRRTDTD